MTEGKDAKIRLARADELKQAQDLVIRRISDLTERYGSGAMAGVRPLDFQLFCQKDDPDGLWVAKSDGEMLGFAFSWVCGDLWSGPALSGTPTHATARSIPAAATRAASRLRA